MPFLNDQERFHHLNQRRKQTSLNVMTPSDHTGVLLDCNLEGFGFSATEETH